MALTEVFTGAEGTLTLATDTSTPEGADAEKVVDAFQIQTVGRVTGVEVRVDTALKAFHEVGRRHPVSLSPGNIAISGRVGRAYINGALLFLLLGRGAARTVVAEPYAQPSFTMSLRMASPARPGESVVLEVRGVKFENWHLVVPEDDFVAENLCFQALSVSLVDTASTSDGAAAAGGGTPVNVSFA